MMISYLKSLTGRACLKVLGFSAALAMPEIEELVRAVHDRHGSFVTIAEVLHGELPDDRVSVLVTWDEALPATRPALEWLADHGVPSLVHIRSEQVETGEGMSGGVIADLSKNPMISFGIGTRTGRVLTSLSDEEVTQEIRQCQLSLTEWTGSLPVTLAYPEGKHDARVRRIAQGLGIRAAFTQETMDIPVPLRLKGDAHWQIGRWMIPI